MPVAGIVPDLIAAGFIVQRGEHMAIAIPKGRDGGREFLNVFVREVQSNGRLEQVEAKAGLKGAVKSGKH